MTDEKQNTEIKKHIRVLTDKLKRFLPDDAPPDIQIVKAHLICEYYLNQILILKNFCSAAKLNQMSFYDKYDKVFDLNNKNQKQIFDSLKILNKIRNRVGHELEYTLSESDVDELGFVRGKEYILEKYDFEKLSDLLRNTLTLIVIDVGLFVFDLVSEQKKSN